MSQRKIDNIDYSRQYECIHCEGIASIGIVKHTEKGTVPEIEFCPFCGLSNAYARETDKEFLAALLLCQYKFKI